MGTGTICRKFAKPRHSVLAETVDIRLLIWAALVLAACSGGERTPTWTIAVPEPATVPEERRRVVPTSAQQRPAPSHRSLVVLDPGHGGHDRGAQMNGIVESDTVLDVAFRTARWLRQLGDVDVLFTREVDEAVALAVRPTVANQRRADVFVSIHVNSSNEELTHGGATVFVGGPPSTSAQSFALADFIEQSIAGRTRQRARQASSRGIRTSELAVLEGLRVPGVLVELAFASFEPDAQLLRQANYRESLARGLAEGILQHLTVQQIGISAPSAPSVRSVRRD